MQTIVYPGEMYIFNAPLGYCYFTLVEHYFLVCIFLMSCYIVYTKDTYACTVCVCDMTYSLPVGLDDAAPSEILAHETLLVLGPSCGRQL